MDDSQSNESDQDVNRRWLRVGGKSQKNHFLSPYYMIERMKKKDEERKGKIDTQI